MKVTNLDAGSFGDRPHPKRKLAQAKTPVNGSVSEGTEPCITLVEIDSEVTDQMRISYDRFWQLLIGRLLDKSPDP